MSETTFDAVGASLTDHGGNLAFAGRPGRWLFAAVCFYVLSQCFNVPILAVGPSWTLWPTLPDLAIGILVLAWLMEFHGLEPRPLPAQRMLCILFLLLLLSMGSYVMLTLLPQLDPARSDEASAGVMWGAYGLVRLVQGFLVFAAISRLSFDAWRCKTLTWVVGLTHLIVSASIIATYFKLVTTADFIRHIPIDSDSAGAWSLYHRNYEGDGLGAQGYNHGYVACQVILLLALRLHLSGFRCGPGDAFFLLLSVVAVFLTRSRAGFACLTLLTAVYLVRNMLHNPLTLLGAAAVLVAGFLAGNVAMLDDNEVLERQVTAFQVHDRENLSGRDEIWEARVGALNQNWHMWFVGRGFGTGSDFGAEGGMHSHNLILHVISETGLVGLMFTAWLWCLLLSMLWSLRSEVHALFWGSSVLLLFSLSYEVFYPIPAMQQFLSFYLAAVAIGLRTDGVTSYDAGSKQMLDVAFTAEQRLGVPHLTPAAGDLA